MLDDESDNQELIELEMVEMKRLNLKVGEAIKFKESIWRQKSRMTWLKDGDSNMTFFFLGRLNEVEALKLDMPFSMEEIKETVWSCDENKASGLDRFNLCFFRKCWKIVQKDLFEMMAEFYKTSKLEISINSSFIALIPKNENPNDIFEFKRISLVSSLYRIMVKVLLRRLRDVIRAVWDLLELVLLKTGFGKRWTSWMLECVSTTRVVRLINVIEVLYLMMDKAKEMGIIEEIKDVILGFGIDDEFMYRMATVCKCKINELSFNYLGIPLGANPRKISTWNRIVKRVERKLSGYKCRSLF
ncbi:hypothetical protein J1N35_029462 [Gossypium stocksii]|uniref:Reverse transcriptase domain-containing protein n=1 Tax=Gossypium stocksii TaxID=47602 RepID=A0A9D3UYB2_9ROSI|nr:hypothetical protein J1N35_029462 [Gossypium stocksii]